MKIMTIGRLKKEEDDDDNGGLFTNELMMINYIQPGKIDAKKPFQERIYKLIEEHKPKKQVQTNVETRIVLKD